MNFKELSPEEIEQEIKNTLSMVENELCFGGNWEDAKARIGRCREHLAKAQLKSQVCPECIDGKVFNIKHPSTLDPCPACQGKGRVEKN